MDYFLKTQNVYQRLMNEYEKYGKLIIAYDYDDTVFDYHSRGSYYNDVIDLLRRLRPFARFIVFTSCNKEKEPEIAQYLIDHDIPFDTINEDIVTEFGGRKVYYNLLLDDRAGLKEVYDLLTRFLEEVSPSVNLLKCSCTYKFDTVEYILGAYKHIEDAKAHLRAEIKASSQSQWFAPENSWERELSAKHEYYPNEIITEKLWTIDTLDYLLSYAKQEVSNA